MLSGPDALPGLIALLNELASAPIIRRTPLL